MTPTPTEIMEEIKQEWGTFQTRHTEQMEGLENRLEPDTFMTEVWDRINPKLSELQDQLETERKWREEQELEAARKPLGGLTAAAATKKEIETLTSWFRGAKGDPEYDLTAEDFTWANGYNRQFNAWLRGGRSLDNGLPDIRNDLSVILEPDGGLWVSPDTSGRMVDFAFDTSPVRQVAAIETIGTDALEGFYDIDTGVSGGWVAEKQTRPETNTPQIGAWRIPVHEQYANPKATQKILDDANRDIQGWLARKTTDIFARTENLAFVLGTGANQPRGFMTYADGVPAGGGAISAYTVIEQIATGDANLLTTDGLIDLVAGLKPRYRQGASFGMNRSSLFTIRKLLDGQNNYIWQPDFSQMRGGNLLGFGISEFEDMADVAAAALPIAFADWAAAYQIVDRMGTRVLQDPYTDKPNILFYTTKRVGGDVLDFDAIKIQDVNA